MRLLRSFVAFSGLLISVPALAASPESGSISPSSPTAEFSGGPYVAPNTSYLEGSAPTCDDSGLNDCELIPLTVTVPADYAAANPGAQVRISLSWTPQAADMDMYLFDADGNQVANSGNLPGLTEAMSVAVGAGVHEFTIRGVPYSGGVIEATYVAELEAGGDTASCDFSGAPTPATAVAPEVSRALRGLEPQAPFGAFVHFSMGSLAEQEQILAQHGLVMVEDFRTYSRAVFATGTAASFIAVARHPAVAYLEANRELQFFGETGPWATRARVAQEAVSGGPYRDANGDILDGRGVTVTVLDSGLNATHPDFEGRVVHNWKVSGDFTGSITPSTFVDMGYTDTDWTSGHGTHVTGTVGGSGLMSEASYGDATAAPNVRGTYAGVAPNTTLQVYSVGEVSEPVGLGPALLLYIDSSLQHMLFNLDKVSPRPRVASLSLGDPAGSNYNPNDVSSCLVSALVEEGVSVVFAAGNQGTVNAPNDDSTSSFCKDPTPGVICVASYHDKGTGNPDAGLSGFSSRGREGFPESYPDIAAPGTNITSTCVQGVQGQITCTTGAEETWAPLYGTISGTSMATPHVSGAIALLYQARPELTPAQVEDLIQDTARKVMTNGPYEPDPQNSDGSINFGFGAGLLDVQAALDKLEVLSDGLDSGLTPTPIIGADLDPALPGAADLVSLTMQEYGNGTGTTAGVLYRVGLADPSVLGPSSALDITIDQFVNGRPYPVSVRLDGSGVSVLAGSADSATLVADGIEIAVPYSRLGYPPVNSMIHNIRMRSVDFDTGRKLDHAPSLDGTPGEFAELQPAYGRAFTVRTDPTGGNPPPPPLPGPGTTTVLSDYNESGTTTPAVCLGCPNGDDGFAVHRFDYTLPYGTDYEAIEFEVFWGLEAYQYELGVVLPDGSARYDGANLLSGRVNGTPAGVSGRVIRIDDPQHGDYKLLLKESVAKGNLFTVNVRTICPDTGCGLSDPPPPTPESACTLPGITMLTSPSGTTGLATPPTGHDDLLRMSVAEPDDRSDRLVFTLKMDNLEPQPQPGYRWMAYFNVPGDANNYWAGMSTSSGAAPVFNYGTRGTIEEAEEALAVGAYVVLGDLPESNWSADGTIELVIDTTIPPFDLARGDVLTGVAASIRQSSPEASEHAGLTTDSASAESDYTLVKNVCNLAPTASLSASETTITEGESVDFTVTMDDADGDALEYTLSFGDGSDDVTGTAGGTVSHGFAAAGSYEVTLNVVETGTSPALSAPEQRVTITVNEEQNTDNGTLASALSCELADAQNDPYTFDCTASSSYLEGGTVNAPQYKLVAGDGSQTDYQASASFTHSYAAAGEYRAFVVARDANGNSAVSDAVVNEVVITINVSDDGENAARLKVDKATGPAPLTVTFDAGSSTVATGYHITGYTWDFDGDGSTDFESSTPVVQHVYTVAGEYTPSVTVGFSNEDGSDTPSSVAKASVAATAPGTPTPPVQQSAGGGSLGWLVLLPLFGGALIRRRRGV